MGGMSNLNPSAFLFPLAQLPVISTATVEMVMEKAALIYSKGDDARLTCGHHSKVCFDDSLAQVDASLRANRKSKEPNKSAAIDSGYASAEEDEEEDGEDFAETLQVVRQDSFEREFTIRWLTGLISRSAIWTLSTDKALPDEEILKREALVEQAASLLSACAHVGEEEEDNTLSRHFAFPLGSSDSDRTIRVELSDTVAPKDHSSVGLQSWASSIYLARLMAEDAGRFGLSLFNSPRIIELGAGTGMLSIVAAKILHSLTNDGLSRCEKTELVATDYHPEVLANLERNIDANFSGDDRASVLVRPFDWQHPSWEHPFDSPFDIILAADVVYDPCHAVWIKNCVSRLLKKPAPSGQEGGVLWMIIALRNTGRHAGLADAVFDVFPISETKVADSDWSLRVVQVQDLERHEGVGRRDEAGYRLLKICWT